MNTKTTSQLKNWNCYFQEVFRFLWCPGVNRTFVKLLKIRLNIFWTIVSSYCGSVVTTNVLELLSTSTLQNFKNRFIIRHHHRTFSENLKINSKIVCYYNVSVFCAYTVTTDIWETFLAWISQGFTKFDFMICWHPGTFKVVHYKKSYLAKIISIKHIFKS